MRKSGALEAAPKTTKWKSLFGFYREDEALSIVKGQGVPLAPIEEQSLSKRIHDAIAYVNALESRTDQAINVQEIPPNEFGERGRNLESDPTFREHMIGMTKHCFAIVDLDDLRLYQPNLNLELLSESNKGLLNLTTCKDC